MRSAPVFAVLLAAAAFAAQPAHADRLALWTIVHGQCAAHAEAGQGPAPCERVDLSRGEDEGVALLKDRVGVAKYFAFPASLTSATSQGRALKRTFRSHGTDIQCPSPDSFETGAGASASYSLIA